MTTGTTGGIRPNPVRCGNCGAIIDDSCFNSGESFPCTVCGTTLRVEVFPALFRHPRSFHGGKTLISDGEAGCFYHGRKKAEAVCDECGRFICALCEVRLGGRSICPECIERGRADGSIERLVTHRTLYDSMTLYLSAVPVLTIVLAFITPVTAPLSIFTAIRFWKKPGSLLPRTKARYVLGIVFSALQIAGWGIFLVFLLTKGLPE